MIPVAVSLVGTRLNKKTVLFIGWFGPRGLASIVLLLIVFDEASTISGMVTIQMVIVTTVLISVFAHGMSAAPLTQRYGKIVESLLANAPEKKDVALVPTRRGGSQHRGDDH